MPKVKTNRAAKKRFHVTKKGKVLRAKAYKQHLLEKKSSKRKRSLRGVALTNSTEMKKVRRMLPYA